MTRIITDLLQNALEGIERHQGDNPDPKLDALRRHIAVFLADQEAAPPSEPPAHPLSLGQPPDPNAIVGAVAPLLP